MCSSKVITEFSTHIGSMYTLEAYVHAFIGECVEIQNHDELSTLVYQPHSNAAHIFEHAECGSYTGNQSNVCGPFSKFINAHLLFTSPRHCFIPFLHIHVVLFRLFISLNSACIDTDGCFVHTIKHDFEEAERKSQRINSCWLLLNSGRDNSPT
ncbi:hypothetical protein KQX54_006719 [Cotesia glomerata]|uniref:Uncharacterized protein n=1 Tax=Cotesia glomerata TaxID=32391 RepID=A0AAV7IXY7_COTGL|nr:hypothetical protein KQX54_006719 [Cotesia glomerata]